MLGPSSKADGQINQNDKRFESEIECSPAPKLYKDHDQDIEVEVINQQITLEE